MGKDRASRRHRRRRRSSRSSSSGRRRDCGRRQLEMVRGGADARVHALKSYLLVALRARRLLVLAQAHQQLAEALLAGPSGAALGALARDVDDLGDALPAGAARGHVVAAIQKGLGLLLGLADQLVSLVVVVLVKVVNVALGLGNGLLPLLGKLLCALGVLLVALLPPGLDDLRLLLVLDGCLVARLEVDGRAAGNVGRGGLPGGKGRLV